MRALWALNAAAIALSNATCTRGAFGDAHVQTRLRAVPAPIFFVRTSTEEGLGPIDACGIASAVAHNPGRLVVVLAASPLVCASLLFVAPTGNASVLLLAFTFPSLFAPHPALAAWYHSGVWRAAYAPNNLGNAARLGEEGRGDGPGPASGAARQHHLSLRGPPQRSSLRTAARTWTLTCGACGRWGCATRWAWRRPGC